MLRDHRHRARLENPEERTEGLLQSEDYGAGIGRFDLLYMHQRGAQARMGFAQEHIDREHDVGGIKIFAIVPFHIVLQGEGIGQTIFRHFPRFRQ